jgi:class 3 adenylate cyclase/tetratricopeptide (TPR) repeat protein
VEHQKEAIMAEESLNRRLAAILVADVVGYGHLMEADEAGTLRAVKQHRGDVIEPAIATNKGRLVKLMGDGSLIEFASVLDAVTCATQIQRQTAAHNAGLAPDRRIELRIGVNLGDVIIDGEDIYGEGVNVAARLESLAEPGGICLSGSVHDAIGNKLPLRCEFLGEQQIKNLERPVRCYRVLGDHGDPSPPPQRTETRPISAFRPASEPTLVVKPFASFGSDSEGEDFAFCLTNGILVALNRMPDLTVIQDESPSFQYASKMSAEELGKRFAVRFLLKGQVHKLGSKVRVNAELLEVSSGRILWADKLDRELRDLGDFFAIQDEITEEIVTALDIKLLSGEMARITRKVLNNPAAHDCLYHGERMLWKAANKLELREAQRLLEEIIRLEPTASIGYAEAALAHWAAAFFGMSDDPAQSLEKAVELARKAIELDDVTGYPHLVLAQAHLHNRNFDEAKAEADHAVSARPSCPASFAMKANVLNHLGEAGDAIEHAQHAFRLSPVHPQIFPAVLASAYHGAERYEEAITAARDAIQLDPNKPEPYVILAACAVALGHVEEAKQAAQEVLTLKPEFNLAAFAKLQPYKDQKHLDRLLDQLGTAGFE